MAMAPRKQSMKATMFREAMLEFWDSVPKLAVNLGTAYLVYLFGTSVFVPVSDALGLTIGGLSVSSVTSAAVLLAMAYLVARSLKEINDISEAMAKFLAVHVGEDVSDEEVQDYRTAIRGFLGAVCVALGLYFFTSVLRTVNVVAAGLVYIVGVVWCILLLLRAGSALDREVTAWAAERARRLELK